MVVATVPMVVAAAVLAAVLAAAVAVAARWQWIPQRPSEHRRRLSVEEHPLQLVRVSPRKL